MSKKFTKESIVRRATEEGYVFKDFSLEHVGRYAAADADWNYKDIPHLHFVHHLAEAIPTIISDDFITSLNTQRMFGMKVPLTVVNYESGIGEQTYYTTLFWFILVIQTRFREHAPLRTSVVTTYSIGMPRLLRWAFPILKWTITRNYRVLMTADIPMRERRGELRSRGFAFNHEHLSYGFGETTLITRQNVVPPSRDGLVAAFEVDLKTVVPPSSETLLGTDDDLGVRAKRDGNLVELFPRICPHEGSCLDKSPVVGGKVHCPWHGREFTTICTVNLEDQDFSGDYLTSFSRIVIRGTRLSLFPHMPS